LRRPDAGDQPRPYDNGGRPRPYDTGSELEPYSTGQLWRREPARIENDPRTAIVPGSSGAELAEPRGKEVQWPPQAPPPMFVHQGRGARLGARAALAALVSVVALTAIGYGIYTVTKVPPLTGLAAQVASTGQVDLGFPESGTLSKVLVHPGEHVTAGQVLAVETVAGLSQQVAADEQEVQTDKLDITELNSLMNEEKQELAASSSSEQQAALSGVDSAANEISSTKAARQATINAFEGEVAAARQTLQADQAQYLQLCGNSPTGGSSCESLSHQVDEDQQALSSAEASLSAQQQSQAEWTAAAQKALADQQAAQAGETQNTALLLAPLTVDLTNARSQLARDQAQLTTDQARSSGDDLQAPQAGTVVSMSGSAGEVVSGSGVSGGGDSGGTVTVTPGFQLFPSQESSVGSQSSATPVAVIEVGGPLLLNVVVPEDQIGLVHVGAPATVNSKVAGLTSLRGTVSQIFPSSIVAAGVVSYEVQVKVDSTSSTRGWLPGMTASANISR
jgi:multidrug efflux pump subunit AcrA (membrane-fusion protein)